MEHRPEIDGIRAIAVAAVILAHAGVLGFAGGFIGVDVFFVISGFLITGILLRDLEAGQFSLAEFYARRARRILPALFVVVAVTAVLAWRWLLPDALETFSKSLIAVAVFASNLWFWRTTAYFAPDARGLPLLHTWSLSVEEQFYLAFPLLMMVG